jgi:hypothetical protein
MAVKTGNLVSLWPCTSGTRPSLSASTPQLGGLPSENLSARRRFQGPVPWSGRISRHRFRSLIRARVEARFDRPSHGHMEAPQ